MSDNATSRRRDFGSIWERFYPLIITMVAVLMLLFIVGLRPTVENVDKMVDASINISSILIGFNGALLGIIISVQDKPLMKKIFGSVKKEEIFSFIRQAIISGFMTLISASTLYVFIKTISTPSYYAFNIWLFIFIYFLTSSYRVIDILMYLLSLKDIQIDPPQTEVLSREKEEELKKQYGRSKQITPNKNTP
ncbi:hypothetical protein LJK88_14635 [Paenibacillus sp. P26]|nr:hypothetical protein LJK88_14635 [Paenibacillus sp. P26]UUZ96876.1 hypothetical protein LJK87_23120 [Paenibacillus sp. P25]